MEKHKVSDFWGMGTAIGLCTAVGIALGALLQNIVFGFLIGAGIGVVIGAISILYKPKM